MQERRGLLEVHADKQPAVGAEQLGDSSKQIARLGGVEIADAGTGEEDCPLLHIEEAGKFERFRIIGTDRMDLQCWMILGDSACRHAESFTRNIDRCVGLGLYRFQQHTNFGATPAPKFEQQTVIAQHPGHVFAIPVQQADFRARRIVFRQPGDGIEQLRS
jgi:hypothetical protein